jgi:hypothetical protein
MQAPSGTGGMPFELIVDDGTGENAIGVGGAQFIWLNRFTPSAIDFPITLERVDITLLVIERLHDLAHRAEDRLPPGEVPLTRDAAGRDGAHRLVDLDRDVRHDPDNRDVAGERHAAVAEAILGSVGKVVHLAEEHMDSVTALAGSGPAYFFLLAEAMIDAGALLGLSRDIAWVLVIQTMVGSAMMLRDSGRHPVELRDAVTSPGGTTIAAVRVLEQERVRAAFLNAIEAAKRRSQELAGS